jgi:ABC-2 type transport system permease protein
MLGSVFAKTVRDRWLGWLVAVLSLAALLFIAMAAYRSVDLGIYTSLPQVYRALLNIPQTADVGSLAISVLVATYGAMTMAAMALSMGAASIAGEERAGTIGLLLANPKSRVHILLSKAAAMFLLTGLGVLGMWASILVSARLLTVSIEGMSPGALMLHLLAGSLFYGFLAMAIGAWTGSRGAAAGTAAGVMVVSFVAAGVLPLFAWGKTVVKVFPWYYFNGSDPLINGVQWWHMSVLLGASAFLVGIALVGVTRRDLKGQSVAVTLLDRIRANPTAEKYLGKILGSALVSSIWAKTASDYRGVLIIVSYYAVLVQATLGPLYAAMPKAALEAISKLPQGLVALVGGGNISTPQGFYQLETFGLMGPILVMVVTVAIGAGGLAGEESRRTMGLLLANPVSRAKVLAEKAWTMLLYAFLVGLVLFAGVALGSVLGGLHISTWNIAATCVLASLVGLVFGTLALALSAGTGRARLSVYGAAGAAIALHLLNAFGVLNHALARWATLSPFHYYLGSDPLNNGMDWGNTAVLAALCAVLTAGAFFLFQRRDIRQQD